MRPKSIPRTAIKLSLVPFAFALAVLAPHRAAAQSADGALVLHGCPDTYLVPGHSDGLAYTVCAEIVFTPSGDVNATLHGALLDPATAPSQAVVVTNFPCAYGDKTTYDSQIVIAPDGSVNGYCRLHPQ